MGKPHPPSADPACPPGDVGRQLRQAREASRLSVASAAATLRLPPRVVEALEAGDFKQFEPVYVRGYLRNYARLLELPADPLVEAYNQGLASEHPPAEPEGAPAPGGAGRGGALRWLLAGGGALLALWGLGKLLPGPAETAPPPPLAVAETAAPSERPPALPGQTPAAAPPPPAAQPSAEPARPPAVPPTPAPEPPAAPSAGQSVVGEGPDRVSIRLTGDAWVSIRDQAGRRLAYQSLPAGTERTYAGQAPFAVVLGNAPAVQIQFNGQPHELPKPKAGTVARFTLGAKP